jgi:hypothetical protein
VIDTNPGDHLVRYFYNSAKKLDPQADAVKPELRYALMVLTSNKHSIATKIRLIWNFVKMLISMRDYTPLTEAEWSSMAQEQDRLLLAQARRFGLQMDQINAIKALWNTTRPGESMFRRFLRYATQPKVLLDVIAAEIQRIVGVPFVVMGHTHSTVVRKLEGGKYGNTGTYGTAAYNYNADAKQMLRDAGDVGVDEFPFADIRVVKGAPTMRVLTFEPVTNEVAPVRFFPGKQK